MRRIALVLAALLLAAAPGRAQTAADSAGVRQASMDYLDGFYTGDSTLHIRSIRPEVYKFGFGRTTDYVNEEIRLQRLTREAGAEIVARYDHMCSPQYIKNYCDYIGISVDDFWTKVRQVSDRRLFDITNTGEIIPKFTVGVGL